MFEIFFLKKVHYHKFAFPKVATRVLPFEFQIFFELIELAILLSLFVLQMAINGSGVLWTKFSMKCSPKWMGLGWTLTFAQLSSLEKWGFAVWSESISSLS